MWVQIYQKRGVQKRYTQTNEIVFLYEYLPNLCKKKYMPTFENPISQMSAVQTKEVEVFR